MERFLYGLGIRHVGAQTAIDLVNNFGSIDKLGNLTIDELESVNGIGTVVAESVIAWFSDKDNIDLLEKFKKIGVNPLYETKSGKLSGISFAVTGSLKSMSRDKAADQIRSKGGVFQSSVGKGTTFLVSGGKIGASKLAKAQSFGTKVIDEAEFLRLIT